MAKFFFYIFVASLLLPSSLLHVSAYVVQYSVVNNATNLPGGKRFDQEIGKEFSISLLQKATQFIWKVLNQPADADRKQVPKVTLYVSHIDDPSIWGYASFPDIVISESVLAGFPRGAAKEMYSGLLYHEATHIFQWDGEGTAPSGLIEGVAEYVKIKAGYESTADAGDGNRWDEGYAVTARFLEYCDSLRPGFTAELNSKMKKSYTKNLWTQMLGKPAEQLWKEYKAKYSHGKSAAYVAPNYVY